MDFDPRLEGYREVTIATVEQCPESFNVSFVEIADLHFPIPKDRFDNDFDFPVTCLEPGQHVYVRNPAGIDDLDFWSPEACITDLKLVS